MFYINRSSMKNKLNAFTLMEVTVAMLISAICITICYTAYSLIQGYYIRFAERNQQADLVLNLKHVLERDFQKALHVIKTEEGLVIQEDSVTIDYSFDDQQILRSIEELHTDTFTIPVQKVNFYFEDREANIADTIDRLHIMLLMNKDINMPLYINKNYSSADLFK